MYKRNNYVPGTGLQAQSLTVLQNRKCGILMELSQRKVHSKNAQNGWHSAN